MQSCGNSGQASSLQSELQPVELLSWWKPCRNRYELRGSECGVHTWQQQSRDDGQNLMSRPRRYLQFSAIREMEELTCNLNRMKASG